MAYIVKGVQTMPLYVLIYFSATENEHKMGRMPSENWYPLACFEYWTFCDKYLKAEIFE